MALRTRRVTIVEPAAEDGPQDIVVDLSAGVGHLRSAAAKAGAVALGTVAPRLGSARVALAPRIDAARTAVAPRVEAARAAIAPALARVSSDGARQSADSAATDTGAKVGRRTARKAARKAAKSAAKSAGRGGRRAARRQVALSALRGQKSSRRWGVALVAFGLGVAAGVAGGLLARRAAEPAWEEYEPVSGQASGRPAVPTDPSHTQADGTAARRSDTVAGRARSSVAAAAGTVKSRVARGRTGAGVEPSEDPTDPIAPLGDSATTTVVVAAAGSDPSDDVTDEIREAGINVVRVDEQDDRARR